MITIGLRAKPQGVTFAIYDSDDRRIVNVEEILIPAAFDPPDALKYLRNNLLDVLREFNVMKAGIRLSEPFARTLSIPRVQIEGVIQEAFASSQLKAFFAGHIAIIATKLGIPKNTFKPLVAGEEEYDVENWMGMTKDEREAVLCAIGAVNA